MSTVLLSTAYLPPIEYIFLCLHNDVMLEGHEHYIKQSYRNRALIATANGVQTLTLPVVHSASKMDIRDVLIDYATPWQRQHWRSIDAAYSGSPYYLYFKDFFLPFFEKKHKYLFDFNTEILSTICHLFNKDITPSISKEYTPETDTESNILDYRQVIHPKKRTDDDYPFKAENTYTQIFEDRIGFIPNLSSIDYLFNMGRTLPYSL